MLGAGAVSCARGGDRLLVLVLGAGAGAVKGCTVRAHTFVRTLFYAQRQALNRPLFQVVLDTAWPWASEAYGLCRLCALFCAHKLIRARSYGRIVLHIVASSVLQRQ